MNITLIGSLILAGIGLCGIIALTILDKSTATLVPLVTALIGFIFGDQKNALISGAKKIVGKK